RRYPQPFRSAWQRSHGSSAFLAVAGQIQHGILRAPDARTGPFFGELARKAFPSHAGSALSARLVAHSTTAPRARFVDGKDREGCATTSQKKETRFLKETGLLAERHDFLTPPLRRLPPAGALRLCRFAPR